MTRVKAADLWTHEEDFVGIFFEPLLRSRPVDPRHPACVRLDTVEEIALAYALVPMV
jgi:hypothetical protein